MSHIPKPMLRENPRSLHHHTVVEEADKDEGNGELHDSVKSFKEEDCIESDGKLQ
jgi:hypothetical protein